MIRIGLYSLALVALVASMPASAQLPSNIDSLDVEVDSAGMWTESVIRDVPIVSEARAAEIAAAAAVGPHWVMNRPRSVGFINEREAARAVAVSATGYHVAVDISDHLLFVVNGRDTLRRVTVATASNATLRYGNKAWRFRTPRGVRTVLAKEKDPVWTPPEWHYAEVANEYGLRLQHLQRGQTVVLHDGTKLLTEGNEVGVIAPGDSEFVPLELDAHIVFDSTLFIPPFGTRHRSIQGELGHYRLKLGNGYQLHGTPYANSIGSSVTHGCVRMGDEDIAWLYENVPVGTKVYLY
jgi:lipoprotein-anchoring transpeptidase ErfK/SrfK